MRVMLQQCGSCVNNAGMRFSNNGNTNDMGIITIQGLKEDGISNIKLDRVTSFFLS